MLHETSVHVILPLILDRAAALLPEQLKAAAKFQMLGYAHQDERLLYEQQVLKCLNDNGIPCAILKGSSVAINYLVPYLRCMGDIDLLVLPEQQLNAV